MPVVVGVQLGISCT